MVFNKKDMWQGRSFEEYGEYSEAEVAIFQKIVKHGDTVIEVGSNMGSFVAPLARMVGPGYLICMEPERHAYYTLCANVAVNNFRNVICLHQAGGEAQGTINVPELDYDRTTNFGGLELDKDYSGGPHYPVFCNTLDSLNLDRCNFIKVDVEGMELQVLKGAESLIKKHQPVLYVECDRAAKQDALVTYLKKLGYAFLLHQPPFWNPDNFYSNKVNVFGDVVSLNLLCWVGHCPVVPADFGLAPLPELPSQ